MRPLAWCVALLLAGSCRPAPRAPVRHVVEIRQLVFIPEHLTVQQGDTVLWINHDLFPHTATADGPEGWDSGPIAAGDSGWIVAGGAGEVGYHCRFHPSMRARLSVR